MRGVMGTTALLAARIENWFAPQSFNAGEPPTLESHPVFLAVQCAEASYSVRQQLLSIEHNSLSAFYKRRWPLIPDSPLVSYDH